jgi:Glycosyltransferase family 87
MRKHGSALVLTAIAIAVFVALVYPSSKAPADFEAFYGAAQRLKAGQGHALYQYATYRDQRPFIRPAWQAVMYLPLGFLGYRTAFWCWFSLSLAFFGATLGLLRKQISALSPSRRLLLALCLSFPIADTLTTGQDSTLFLLLVVLGWRALLNRQDWRAGVFLGLASFKLHLLLPGLVLVMLRRKWRVLGSVAAMGAGLLVISALVAGAHWVGECLRAQQAASAMHGLGILRHLLTLAGLSQLALPAMTVGFVGSFWLLRRTPLDRAFPRLLVIATILNWHAFPYDYLTALPALVLSRTGRAELGSALSVALARRGPLASGAPACPAGRAR